MPRAVLAFALFLLFGCQPEPTERAASPIKVEDHTGRTVELPAPAQRVISLMPAVTDALLAMGAADRLIARTQFDTDPRLAALPSTGNALTPSLEWLTALKPDLVITWPDQPSRPVVSRLTTIGVPVYAARTESIADALRVARDLGVMLGETTRADSLTRALNATFDSVRASTARHKRVTVAYFISVDPPMVAGAGTFIHELLVMVNAENVFADAGALWPQISMEELIRRQPEALIVVAEPGAKPVERIRNQAGWRELAAIRTGRVLEVDANVFSRPGPQLADAARRLASFLHGGLD